MQNRIPKPSQELGKILASSVNETKNSVPSFNDYQYTMGRQSGFAKANRYLVLIFPNDYIRSATGMRTNIDIARLATTCKSINLNEQTWYTTSQEDIHAGSSRVFPYKRNTNNSNGVRLQFNCGADMFEKEFFEQWLRSIQDPYTRRWQYYDTYANGSEMYAILLPNDVANFYQAVGALFSKPTKLTGYKFTEVYPYSININGGALNYQTASEPLFMDIGFMYHDMVPLTEDKVAAPNAIKPVTESGFPVIDGTWSDQIIRDSERGLNRAVNGFVVGANNARKAFARDEQDRGQIAAKQRSVLESYVTQIQEVNLDVPRAVDGLVVQPPPGNGALDLGLTILSQVQGFFGAGFYGNGFNP